MIHGTTSKQRRGQYRSSLTRQRRRRRSTPRCARCVSSLGRQSASAAISCIVTIATLRIKFARMRRTGRLQGSRR